MATADNVTRSSAVPILAVLGCVLALVAGGLLTRPNFDWYATLQKPGFEPPNRAFTIVWPILYAVMAVSAWLAWRAPGRQEDRKVAFIWFFIQLALGVLWSYAFFWLHNTGFGLAVINGVPDRYRHDHRPVRSPEPGCCPAARPARALGLLRDRAQFRVLHAQ